MKKQNKAQSIACFKRWSRKSYSAFASLGREVRIGVLCVSMCIVSLSASTHKLQAAAPADSLAQMQDVPIEGVSITHKRSNPTRSMMTATPVFNRKKEAAAPLQTLESALSLSPAIDLRERGSRGTQADISIRGGSFDQTQIMLNGINFTDARTGHQSHSLPIDMETISSIELIDGVTGVGAYAGAINIRTAPKQANYIGLDMSGGGFGYAYANLSGGYTKERFNVFSAASYRRSDGYAYNTNFDNWNAYTRATYSNRLGFFDAQLGYQKRDFGANGYYSLKNKEQAEHTQTALGSLRWVGNLTGKLTLTSSLSYRKNFDNYEWIKGSPVGENFHNTDNVGAEIFALYDWQAGETKFGADYAYNHIFSTNMGDELDSPNGRYTHAADRHTQNYYIAHTKNWQGLSLSASFAVAATEYGEYPTWSFSAKQKAGQNLSIEAGVNRSLRLPTFTDLYYNSPSQVSNPLLEPEQATTYRLLANFAKGVWSGGAEIYFRDGENTIDWTMSPEEDKYHSRQITSLETFGIEWRGAYSLEGKFFERLQLSYAHTIQSKDSGDYISLYALNNLKHKAIAALTLKPFEKVSWSFIAGYYARNGNYANEHGEIEAYEPYFKLDSKLSWQLNRMSIFVEATNLTSTKYFDYGGLEMAPLWASAGISLTL